MDHSKQWNEFLSMSADLQGGALIGMDSVLISCSRFDDTEHREISIAHCIAAVRLACEINRDAKYGAFEMFVLRGRRGNVIFMPILNMAIFVVLAHKQANIEQVLLDMRRAIWGPFHPGLLVEPAFPPHPPKRDRAKAFANPED